MDSKRGFRYLRRILMDPQPIDNAIRPSMRNEAGGPFDLTFDDFGRLVIRDRSPNGLWVTMKKFAGPERREPAMSRGTAIWIEQD